jgi:Holliday junction resolvase RusA-like endonuclease
MQTLIIPIHEHVYIPSAKNCYQIYRKGRFASIGLNKKAKNSQEYITGELIRLKKELDIGMQTTPCNIKFEFYYGSSVRADTSNAIAIPLDCLMDAGILVDDNMFIVRSHDGTRSYIDRDNPRVEITIEDTYEYLDDVVDSVKIGKGVALIRRDQMGDNRYSSVFKGRTYRERSITALKQLILRTHTSQIQIVECEAV